MPVFPPPITQPVAPITDYTEVPYILRQALWEELDHLRDILMDQSINVYDIIITRPDGIYFFIMVSSDEITMRTNIFLPDEITGELTNSQPVLLTLDRDNFDYLV